MPDWVGRVRATVVGLAARATRSSADAAAVTALVRQVVDALLAGDPDAAESALTALKTSIGAERATDLLLLEAVASGKAATVGAVVAFVVAQGVATVAGLLARTLPLLDGGPARKLLLTAVLEATGRTPPHLVLLLENSADLAATVVRLLFDLRIASWDDLAGFFDAPDTPERFAWLVALVARVAHDLGAVERFAKALVEWMQAGPATPAVAVDHPMWAHLEDTTGFVVPPRTYRVALLVGRLSGPDISAQALTLPIVRAIAAALLALEDAAAAILAQLAGVPGAFAALLPALIDIAVSIPMRVFTWIGTDIEQLPNVKVLPAPEVKGPYMIFSDLHRDHRRDEVQPNVFDVSHFRQNAALYARALRYCRDAGYTVIENGDCEELWYLLFGTVTQSERANAITGEHAEVYDLLAELHGCDRYYRTRGNHDNWWALRAGRTGPLDTAIRRTSPHPLTVWEGLIIEDVRSMQLAPPFTNPFQPAGDTLAFLLDYLPVGLSPLRYEARLPMFVLHGHQVDFWNCDEHHFLGLFITNAVGVPADGVDALPYYLKGLDFNGNPVLRFSSLLENRSPWDNWLPDDVAVPAARRIETMRETDRRLQDTVMFSESLAASLSFLLDYDPGPDPDFCESPMPRVQIAMGHTHNPQSRPYLNLTHVPPGTAKQVLETVKLPYYNSGTGGWWEDIIWALEITRDGQPRLVYWDAESCEPHVMTWELHNRERYEQADIDALVARVEALLASLPAPAAGLGVAEMLQQVVDTINATAPPAFPLRRMEDNLRVDASGLDAANQYATVVWAQLREVTDDLCAGRAPTIVDLTFDLATLPTVEVEHQELPRAAAVPKTPPPAFVDQWFQGLGIKRSQKPAARNPAHLRAMSGVLMHAAYLYGSGLCHALGFTLHRAASGSVPVRSSWDGRKLRLQIGGKRI